jgi:hypothetical protein
MDCRWLWVSLITLMQKYVFLQIKYQRTNKWYILLLHIMRTLKCGNLCSSRLWFLAKHHGTFLTKSPSNIISFSSHLLYLFDLMFYVMLHWLHLNMYTREFLMKAWKQIDSGKSLGSTDFHWFSWTASGPGYWILYSGLGFWYGTVAVFLVDTNLMALWVLLPYENYTKLVLPGITILIQRHAFFSFYKGL